MVMKESLVDTISIGGSDHRFLDDLFQLTCKVFSAIVCDPSNLVSRGPLIVTLVIITRGRVIGASTSTTLHVIRLLHLVGCTWALEQPTRA